MKEFLQALKELSEERPDVFPLKEEDDAESAVRRGSTLSDFNSKQHSPSVPIICDDLYEATSIPARSATNIVQTGTAASLDGTPAGSFSQAP